MSDPPGCTGVLKWDIAEIAQALEISEGDVKEYFTDGRRVSFLLERRICREIFHGTLAPTEGAGFDLIDSHGAEREVRSISKGGVNSSPQLHWLVRKGTLKNKVSLRSSRKSRDTSYPI
jgi:hypothetical protein